MTVGYFAPHSPTRVVIGDPAALVGGISALYLQALHPRAMAGVLEHSSFPDDFWPRLQRTIAYVTTLAFADTATADEAVARVRRIHAHVRGVDPVTGSAYSADDPELLRWVHVCEVSSFVGAVHRIGVVDDAQADAFLAEQVRAAELLGATDVPASRAEVAAYFAQVRPELVASPAAKQAVRRLLVPPMPWKVAWLTPARPAWAALSSVAIGLLPEWARRLYGLPVLPGADAMTTAGLWSVRTALMGARQVTGRHPPG
ncbi:oxygenase MpaB family protein [Pseudonocardia sp. CA-107938]|uniref:oxygenase MpaB family protein n=1 Tax=Pseudonocardia sp. CA-107938 TaxID=3240021 RepID=UPI003D8F277B